MKRLTEAWFEFDGVKSSDRGVILRAMPRRPIPAERGEAVSVPGRSGFLWIGEGAFETIKISVECESTTGYRPDAAAAWLKGRTGLLRFSDEPDRAYRARCIAAFARESKFLSFDTQVFKAEFDCQPYRYAYPAPAAVTLSESGATVANEGTVDSLPRVTIMATGEGSVTVNGYEVAFSSGSVIIDSELEDCFEADGATLANHRVTMLRFPRLKSGANLVSWTGGVTGVTIEKRSRYL